MENIKLLFIIPSLQAGGAERVLTMLANHFSHLNCKLIIVALNHGELAYPVDENVKIIYLLNRKNDHFHFRIYYALQIFMKLMSLLIKERPACVLSFITSANLWTGITCSLVGIPYIVSERTSPNRTINKFNSFLKWISYIIYKKSVAVVVGAKGIENCLRENEPFNKLANFNIITNSVPLFKSPSKKKVHYRKFILGVGRLSYVKGFDQLIEAYSKSKINDVDLLIVGEGNERANLICQIYNLGLKDRVKLIGSQNNLQDYYAQAEIFVLPSRNEGYPNALIEAMSFGCPSIAFDCEFGPSEIIEDDLNGLLVENSNIPGLCNAIVRALKNPLLRKTLGRNAIMINYTNSPDIILKKWEKLIFQSYKINQ